MSGLFRKEAKSSAVIVEVQPASPMHLLNKGTKAANEEPASATSTLDAQARFAAQQDAKRDVGRRGFRPRR